MIFQIKEFYHKIETFFFPRQSWLFKKIPNHWIDKDTLWEICILEGIKHFVEEEHCFNVLSSGEECSYEEQKIFMNEVKENYRLITQVLPDLEAQLEIAWKNVPLRNITDSVPFNYKEIYGETDRLDKEISDLKTTIMKWAVEKREWIWT